MKCFLKLIIDVFAITAHKIVQKSKKYRSAHSLLLSICLILMTGLNPAKAYADPSYVLRYMTDVAGNQSWMLLIDGVVDSYGTGLPSVRALYLAGVTQAGLETIALQMTTAIEASGAGTGAAAATEIVGGTAATATVITAATWTAIVGGSVYIGYLYSQLYDAFYEQGRQWGIEQNLDQELVQLQRERIYRAMSEELDLISQLADLSVEEASRSIDEAYAAAEQARLDAAQMAADNALEELAQESFTIDLELSEEELAEYANMDESTKAELLAEVKRIVAEEELNASLNSEEGFVVDLAE